MSKYAVGQPRAEPTASACCTGGRHEADAGRPSHAAITTRVPNTSRRVLLLSLALLFAACGGEEQRSLNFRAALTVLRDGGEIPLAMEGRLYEGLVSGPAFEDAWDVFTRGTAPYEGIAVTLGSTSTPGEEGSPLTAGLVLVLPTPLREGTRYAIGGAVPPPTSELPMYWSTWGQRALGDPDQAKVALRIFDYRAVGMRIENDFAATGATGTIEVVNRSKDYLELRLDVTATDAAGQTIRLRGDMSVAAERYTPPIS